MPDEPKFIRTPQGEFVLSDPVADLGFSIGPAGTSPRLRLQIPDATVIWADVPLEQIKRFVEQWNKWLRR